MKETSNKYFTFCCYYLREIIPQENKIPFNYLDFSCQGNLF